jgi:hypothetical protein
MLGMGSMLENDSPEKIPIPSEKFDATYIDQMDVITECSEVSINGKTFIEGKKGEGLYTINFKDIREIVFLKKEDKLRGIVNLLNDESVDMILNNDHKAYGKTKYGTFQIVLAKLNKMIINHKGSEQ